MSNHIDNLGDYAKASTLIHDVYNGSLKGFATHCERVGALKAAPIALIAGAIGCAAAQKGRSFIKGKRKQHKNNHAQNNSQSTTSRTCSR